MSARRDLAPGRYDFDTLNPGDRTHTGWAEVSAELIDRFADVSGDRFEIHMDRDRAGAHGFTDRVAHGLLVLSVVDGLKNNNAVTFDAIASLGWDWSFRRPVLAGDRIRAEITLREKRPTRHADRGILTLGFVVSNQDGVTVQDGINRLMVYRRGTASAG